jgi:uncharacterized protein (DUF433 family)
MVSGESRPRAPEVPLLLRGSLLPGCPIISNARWAPTMIGWRCDVEVKRMNEFRRITQDPAVMGGKACIRGQRVTVGMIVGQIGAGRSIDALLADYPYLAREDVLEALRYAAWRAEEREVDLQRAS